ncbi:isochorismatase family protein, partial [Biomphalaria glabrata]
WPDFVCVVCLIIVHFQPTQAANTQTVSAFVIIDVQECFLEGGNLAVKDGNAVIEVIN